MAVSKQQLAQIIGKARDLCNPEGDRLVESYRGQGNSGNNDPDPSQYDDYSQYDSMYLNEEESYQPQPQPRKRKPQAKDIRYNQMTAEGSRMDENIKQSMLNHVIDASPLGNQSVLDGMDIPEGQVPQRRQAVNEQRYTQQGVGIDYSIIKAIVNECLNDYFSRQPLNESASISTIGLKPGVIKVVDSKGNVFSGKLEKIGNANK